MILPSGRYRDPVLVLIADETTAARNVARCAGCKRLLPGPPGYLGNRECKLGFLVGRKNCHKKITDEGND